MIKVFESAVIRAPLSIVWNTVRDFGDMPRWHPAIAKMQIENNKPADAVGCIRDFYLNDGTHLRERLLMLSDADTRFSYEIVDAELDLQNYVAGLKLMPITDCDNTFGVWTAEFTTSTGKEEEMANLVGQGVFQVGFAALNKILA